MASLSLKNVTKKYPNGFVAVKEFNLEIADKEFIIFVGPSGCGKSTTLRMIAGLEDISSGELYIDDKLVNDVEPKDRDIAMVFQNYALYPHMSVYDNMAFGLKLRKTPKDEIDKKVHDAAKILDLEHLLDRKPKALSGGQRQRVMIAMALACEPKLLIADEPTTALDVTIQAQILELIRNLQKELNMTVVYITHDLGVVANVADRVAVMYAGQIVEYGMAEEIFYNAWHPYTWALLSALPQLGVKGEELPTIEGTPPNLFNEIKGDAFAPRNKRALAIDFEEEPPFFDVTETHKAKTWYLDPRAPKIEQPDSIRKLREKMIGKR